VPDRLTESYDRLVLALGHIPRVPRRVGRQTSARRSSQVTVARIGPFRPHVVGKEKVGSGAVALPDDSRERLGIVASHEELSAALEHGTTAAVAASNRERLWGNRMGLHIRIIGLGLAQMMAVQLSVSVQMFGCDVDYRELVQGLGDAAEVLEHTPIVAIEFERIGEQSDRLAMRTPGSAEFQVPNRPDAEAREVGQFLLRKAGSMPPGPQELREAGSTTCQIITT
jgi:hypothetical protein